MDPLPPPIAQHELLELLGAGGMGRVFLARKDGALVALKTMRADQANEPRVRSLFAKEMRVAASIDHPNVARVLSSGEEAGVPYLAMEWVDGCSLRHVTRGGAPVPLGVALRVTADACAGLHAAHELTNDEGVPLGLVHRDVSPHNIIVGRDGVAKLIDFGVAKVIEAVTGDTTSSGGIKGKVRYMAPEQARARPVDRRADIFALGAVLFELVVGVPPFEGANDLAILHQLLTPEAISIPLSVPAPVAAVLARALAKKPAARFASAAEMLGAIDALGLAASHADVAAFVAGVAPSSVATSHAPPMPVTRSARRSPRRAFFAVAGVALACLVGALGAVRLASADISKVPAHEAPAARAAALPPAAAPLSVAAALPAALPAVLEEEKASEPPPAPDARLAEPRAKTKPVRAGARRATTRASTSPRPPDDLTTSLRDRR